MNRATVSMEHLLKAYAHAVTAWDQANHELLLSLLEISNAWHAIRPRRIA